MTNFPQRLASRTGIRSVNAPDRSVRIRRVPATPPAAAVAVSGNESALTLGALRINDGHLAQGRVHLIHPDSESVDTVTAPDDDVIFNEDVHVVSPLSLSPAFTSPPRAVAASERTVAAPVRHAQAVPDFWSPNLAVVVGGANFPRRVQLAPNGEPDPTARRLAFPEMDDFAPFARLFNAAPNAAADAPDGQFNNMDPNQRRAFEPLSNFQRGRLANRLASPAASPAASPTNSPTSSPRNNNNNFFPSDF